MSHDSLTEIIQSLEELKGMHQLNYELLEQIDIIFGYFRENNIRLPNEEKLVGLLSKALALLSEIRSSTPKTLLFHKLSDDSYHEASNRRKVNRTLFATITASLAASKAATVSC